eukprot:Skav229126  [mRNA]  locus=scaffold2966:72467:96226:+ [translate_table: standard]
MFLCLPSGEVLKNAEKERWMLECFGAALWKGWLDPTWPWWGRVTSQPTTSGRSYWSAVESLGNLELFAFIFEPKQGVKPPSDATRQRVLWVHPDDVPEMGPLVARREEAGQDDARYIRHVDNEDGRNGRAELQPDAKELPERLSPAGSCGDFCRCMQLRPPCAEDGIGLVVRAAEAAGLVHAQVKRMAETAAHLTVTEQLAAATRAASVTAAAKKAKEVKVAEEQAEALNRIASWRWGMLRLRQSAYQAVGLDEDQAEAVLGVVSSMSSDEQALAETGLSAKGFVFGVGLDVQGWGAVAVRKKRCLAVSIKEHRMADHIWADLSGFTDFESITFYNATFANPGNSCGDVMASTMDLDGVLRLPSEGDTVTLTILDLLIFEIKASGEKARGKTAAAGSF